MPPWSLELSCLWHKQKKNIAKKGRRELEEGVRKCIEHTLGLLPPPQVSLMINVLGQVFQSEVAHLWARWLRNPCRLGDPHRCRAGGKIRNGPLVGKVATSPLPCRGSPPLQSGGGGKSEVAHLWAKWLRHPCRLGDPHHFRAGGKIRSGAQKRAELLRNSCFLGDPQKGGIDMAHVGPGQKGL